MFQYIDASLRSLLDDPAISPALKKLADADPSFETPDHAFVVPTDLCVNLFLYEVKENLILRNPPPRTELLPGGVSMRRRAPLRVDCSYLVTAWARKPPKTEYEHQLLGEAFNWLSRFPVIPPYHLTGTGLDNQEFPPPTVIAQMDGAKNAGEFWHALGIAPRPYFNLMVTITMDLDQSVEDALVTTIASRYRADDPASMEERLIVSGTARDRHGNALADAWVRLEPTGETAVTNGLGQFVFSRATRGAGYTLRARSQGLIDAQRLNVEVPSPSGEYDIHFT